MSLGDQAVELGISGVPTGVVASFDATTLTGSKAQLTLRATADASSGENTIVV